MARTTTLRAALHQLPSGGWDIEVADRTSPFAALRTSAADPTAACRNLAGLVAADLRADTSSMPSPCRDVESIEIAAEIRTRYPVGAFGCALP